MDTDTLGQATFVTNFVKGFARSVGHLMVGDWEENCGGIFLAHGALEVRDRQTNDVRGNGNAWVKRI
jgi:hypothetical protein